jgi:hypothetical protein
MARRLNMNRVNTPYEEEFINMLMSRWEERLEEPDMVAHVIGRIFTSPGDPEEEYSA